MNITINTRDCERSTSLDEYIKNKFSKLEHFKISFTNIYVFMKLEPEHTFIVEIATKSNLGQIDSQGEGKELIEGFNHAFSRLERLIIKDKQKPLSHRSKHVKIEKNNLIDEENDNPTL